MLPSGGLVRDTRQALRAQIEGLYACCSTALYRSVTLGLQRLSARRQLDIASGFDSNYILFLQTDGVDNQGGHDTLYATLPNGEDPSEPHIYAIGFGSGADLSTLSDLATRTNGKYFPATTSTLSDIYQQITYEI